MNIRTFQRCDELWRRAEIARSKNDEKSEYIFITKMFDKLENFKRSNGILRFSKITNFDIARKRLEVLQKQLNFKVEEFNPNPILPPLTPRPGTPRPGNEPENYEKICSNLKSANQGLLRKISQLEIDKRKKSRLLAEILEQLYQEKRKVRIMGKK